MRILIVSESENQGEYWERLIALVVPEATIERRRIADLKDIPYQERFPSDLIFLISIEGNTPFYQWLDYTKVNEIPLICSVEQIDKAIVEQLKNYAVKGYVNVHCSIDELRTAIDMVCNKKGTFLKFVN
ncbi:hypothetical protein D7X33_19215 [Butyricicoccus sp. 1XD8-22]|nr:hypothetical protein D7X33_19215 [Butyricicoccus sp. 1XD8-22]